jgi:hypothetical protein
MRIRLVALVALTASMAAGCGGSSQTVMPQVTAPSQVASSDENLASFGGTWASGPDARGGSAGTCSDLQWQLPNAGTTGTGRFSATCNGVQIAGSVTVAVARGSLAWRVGGRTTASGRPCEFSLAGTATLVRPSGLQVDYSGTVCGTPVSGSQIWQRS